MLQLVLKITEFLLGIWSPRAILGTMVKPLLLLTLACTPLPEERDPPARWPDLPTPRLAGSDTGGEDGGGVDSGADTGADTGEEDLGPAWALIDEPEGAATEGALLVVADGALWRVESAADGVSVDLVADVTGYATVNAAEGVAVLLSEARDRLLLVELSSGEALAEISRGEGEIADALWACGHLWVADGARQELEVVDLDTLTAVSVGELGHDAELRAEDAVIYASYGTAEGRGSPDEVAVYRCEDDPTGPATTFTLGEGSRHGLWGGRWGAGRTQGYEGYNPYQVSIAELDASTGEERWSWLSEEDFYLSAYAALPGLLHVARAHHLVWEPYTTGAYAIWALGSRQEEPTRVLDASCDLLALAPREDGGATLWCAELGALSQITLTPAGAGTWAGAPAVALMTGVSDMVWTP